MDYQLIAGMHIHAPKSIVLSGSIPWLSLRTHDLNDEFKSKWYHLESEPGVYDTLALNELREYCLKTNKKIVHTLYGTPEFYSPSKTVDSYGHVGGNAPPTNIVAWKNMIRHVLTEIGDVISILQVWNEPAWVYEGTVNDLVGMYEAAVEVAREVNPTILVSWPSIPAGHINSLEDFVSKSTIRPDVVSLHAYNHSLTQFQDLIAHARNILSKTGWDNVPIAMTEMGIQPEYSIPHSTSPWLGISDEKKGELWISMCKWATANNVCGMFWYDWDGYSAERHLYPMGNKPEFAKCMPLLITWLEWKFNTRPHVLKDSWRKVVKWIKSAFKFIFG